MSIVLETKENEPQSSEIIKYLSDSDIKQEPQNDDELVKEVQNYTKEQILYLIEISSKCERFQHVIFAYENLYTLFPSTFLSLDELSPLETSLKIFVAQKQKNLKKSMHRQQPTMKLQWQNYMVSYQTMLENTIKQQVLIAQN